MCSASYLIPLWSKRQQLPETDVYASSFYSFDFLIQVFQAAWSSFWRLHSFAWVFLVLLMAQFILFQFLVLSFTKVYNILITLYYALQVYSSEERCRNIHLLTLEFAILSCVHPQIQLFFDRENRQERNYMLLYRVKFPFLWIPLMLD